MGVVDRVLARVAKRDFGPTVPQMIARPPVARRGSVAVTNDSALRHSAVWACLRLRANVISTLPVDAFRRVGGVQVEVPRPPVLVNPGGERVGMKEWMYSTQFDLDRAGNVFGLVTARDGLGFPARIDLCLLSDVSVRAKDGKIVKYRIRGKEYDPSAVWHERQYTVAGLPIGLSPVGYAAWSIGEYLSIQEFALDWFGNGAIPSAHLRNNRITTMKDIDAAATSGNLTYANITQRNLQFLVMNLGPAIIRREDALSGLMSRPRYVKLKTDALVRMDPKTRAEMLKIQIDSRTRAPSEARELDNLPPFTEEQLAEFDRLFGPAKGTTPTPVTPAMG